MVSSMVIIPSLLGSTQFLAKKAVPKTLSWGALSSLSLPSGCFTHTNAPLGDPKF